MSTEIDPKWGNGYPTEFRKCGRDHTNYTTVEIKETIL
jgi:hypothetical protein